MAPMEASGGSTAEVPVEAAASTPARATFHAQNLASVLNNPLAADPAAAASASLGTAVVQLGAAGEGLWRGDWSTALDQLGAAAASAWEGGSSGIIAADASLNAGVEELQPLTATTALPEVALADFTNYLRLVREKYPRFVAAREAAAAAEEAHAGNQAQLAAQKGRGGGGTMGEGLVRAMAGVPAPFFEADYDLARCAEVQESLAAREADPTGAGQAVSINLLLQERLSHYLDIVEIHLLQEIGTRSDSFFQALAVLNDLGGLMHKVCDKISGLRDIVRSLDAQLLTAAQRMQRMHTRRRNLLAVHATVKAVESVSHSAAALQLLVATGDFTSALDVIDDLRKAMNSGELRGLHCFRHLPEQVDAAAAECDSILTGEFLRQVQRAVLGAAEAEGAEMHEEEEEEEEQALAHTLEPLVRGLLRTGRLAAVLRAHAEQLAADIKDAVKHTLSRTLPTLGDGGVGGGLAGTLGALSNDAMLQLLQAVWAAVSQCLGKAQAIRATVERAVLEASGARMPATASTPKEGGEPSPRPLSPSTAHASAVNSAPASSSFSAMLLGLDPKAVKESLRANDAAVAAAVEAAHQRWVKLLAVRSALHAKLPLSDFAAVVDVSHAFMAATEAGLENVGGAKGHALRASLHLHAKGFLDATHQRHMSRLATLLESEAWQATPVDVHFQATADWVAKGAEAAARQAEAEKQQQPSHQQADADGSASTSTVSSTSKLTVAVDDDAAEAAQRRRKEEPPAHEKFRAALGPLPTRTSGAAGEPAAQLMVGGDGFHMVNSGLMVLTMLGEYLEVTRRLPLLSTEVVHRVAELLKLFNSRTCQLVLGAGAMQVSGLKSISAKHLALANQAVCVVLALLPSVSVCLGALLPETRHLLLLSELDRLRQDYALHRDEIHSKLVTIMQERLRFHSRKLPNALAAWTDPAAPLRDAADATPPPPSEFATALVKELGVLQRVLSPLLLPWELPAVFSRVAANYAAALVKAFEGLDLQDSQSARWHVYADGLHLVACLQQLPREEAAEKEPDALDEWLRSTFADVVKATEGAAPSA